MHDGLQLGTIALVLFGIILNRYDYNALRKEMREKLTSMRASIERQTTELVKMIFTHEQRLAKIEAKVEDK